MKLADLIHKLNTFDNRTETVVEINGARDFEIDEIYVDGKGTLCLAIKVEEDEVRKLI